MRERLVRSRLARWIAGIPKDGKYECPAFRAEWMHVEDASEPGKLLVVFYRRRGDGSVASFLIDRAAFFSAEAVYHTRSVDVVTQRDVRITRTSAEYTGVSPDRAMRRPSPPAEGERP
jgi:hypothetical protein